MAEETNSLALHVLDKNGQTAVHQACARGDLELLKNALHYGLNINTIALGSIGTPLCIACENGYIEIVQYLLAQKPQPNIHLCTKAEHATALHKAALGNWPSIIKLLVENKANTTAKDITDSSALHYAAKSNAIEASIVLFEMQVPINGVDLTDSTPLHHLAASGSTDIVSLFIKHQGDINMRDNNGMTPLLRACFHNNAEVVKILLQEKADASVIDARGNNALRWACLMGSSKIIKYLLEAGTPLANFDTETNYSTPLHLAARSGDSESISILIKGGCNINELDNGGNTALHAACVAKNGIINIDTVVSLLENGVGHDIRNNEGFTAIEEGLEGRDDSFDVNCFSKVISSSLPEAKKLEILRTIIIHPSFDPNNKLFKMSALAMLIRLKFFKLAEILLQRGAEYIVPSAKLPQMIFECEREEFIDSFLDIVCGSNIRMIRFSYCNLTQIPFVLIEKLQLIEQQGNTKEKKTLDLSGNFLHNIPSILASLTILGNVKLDGNPLSLIPESIRSSWIKIQTYLRNLEKRAESWSQCKIIIVGEEGTGKTTLLRSIKKKKGKTKLKENLSTNGIEIHKRVNLSKPKTSQTLPHLNLLNLNTEPETQFNIWDFGGQEIFYPTHQFFLTKHSMYIIVFNAAEFKRDRIEYWMWQIRAVADPNNPPVIFLVGTHVDHIKKTEQELKLTEHEMRRQFPQQRFAGLRDVFFISSRTGYGVQELREQILEAVQQQENIFVQSSWIRLLDILEEKSNAKSKKPYIKWSEFMDWASSCDVPKTEIQNCANFLVESGRIVSLHEPDEIDNGIIILDPLWLSTLMGNFLTFKHTWVKKGILRESHINQIFMDYPPKIHLVLINMLKKFNILYPLQSSATNECSFIIPSMLPTKLSENDILQFWVDPFSVTEYKTFGRNYLFSFMPHGLISRLIVRLLHLPSVVGLSFAKESVLLNYHGQIAMLEYFPSEYKLAILIRVPAIIQSDLFFRWILDVTDTLLEDSFQMTKAFRRTIPCTHCLLLAREQATTKTFSPFSFTFRECVEAITNKRTSVFCNHIHSPSREVRLAELAPDIAFADIKVIKNNDIHVEKLLASSAFGCVYSGSLKSTNKAIAIKQLSQGSSSRGKEELFRSFQQEVYIMSKLKHINLVGLIGVSLYPNIQIILELLHHGDLFTLLHPNETNQSHENSSLSSIDAAKFPWSLRLRIALDVAQGMKYLQSQSPAVIHRDLRSPNIFLASLSELAEVRAKVADFGMSRFVAPVVEGTLNTWEWMAPETLSNDTYTLSADIYSFGIVCWEIASRSFPFDEYYNSPQFLTSDTFDPLKIKQRIIHDNLRPSITLVDDTTPTEFKKLIQDCWEAIPTNRPLFDDITNRLLKLCKKFPTEENLYPDPEREKQKTRKNTNSLLNLEVVVGGDNNNTWNNAFVKDFQITGKIQLLFPATCLCVVRDKIWIGCRDGSILIVDRLLHHFEHRWKAHERSVSSILHVDDYVWTAAVGGCVRIWNEQTLKEIIEFHPFRSTGESIKQMLLVPTCTGGFRVWGVSPRWKELFIWDAETLELIHFLPLPKGKKVTILQFSFLEIDGIMTPIVLAGDFSGDIHMIQVDTLQFFASWKAHDGPISGIQCASGSNAIELWTSCRTTPELKIWKPYKDEMILEKTFAIHSKGGILMLQSNPAAQAICSVSGTTIVCLNTASQKAVQEMDEHRDVIISIFGHSNVLYSISKDGWIFLWEKRKKFVSLASSDSNTVTRHELYANIIHQKAEKQKAPTMRRSMSQSNLQLNVPSVIFDSDPLLTSAEGPTKDSLFESRPVSSVIFSPRRSVHAGSLSPRAMFSKPEPKSGTRSLTKEPPLVWQQRTKTSIVSESVPKKFIGRTNQIDKPKANSSASGILHSPPKSGKLLPALSEPTFVTDITSTTDKTSTQKTRRPAPTRSRTPVKRGRNHLIGANRINKSNT